MWIRFLLCICGLVASSNAFVAGYYAVKAESTKAVGLWLMTGVLILAALLAIGMALYCSVSKSRARVALTPENFQMGRRREAIITYNRMLQQCCGTGPVRECNDGPCLMCGGLLSEQPECQPSRSLVSRHPDLDRTNGMVSVVCVCGALAHKRCWYTQCLVLCPVCEMPLYMSGPIVEPDIHATWVQSVTDAIQRRHHPGDSDLPAYEDIVRILELEAWNQEHARWEQQETDSDVEMAANEEPLPSYDDQNFYA